MLQRIQTLYLFISTVLSGALILILPFWKNINDEELYILNLLEEDSWKLISIAISFGLSGLLSFISIFLYKNRKKQIIINRLNIVVNFYLLGIIVYHLLIISGESKISEKGIGLFIPILVIVLLALANKAILKDEKLVKSVDRLR
jgi:hypothetical protein